MQASLPQFVDAVKISDIGQGVHPIRITAIRPLPDREEDGRTKADEEREAEEQAQPGGRYSKREETKFIVRRLCVLPLQQSPNADIVPPPTEPRGRLLLQMRKVWPRVDPRETHPPSHDLLRRSRRLGADSHSGLGPGRSDRRHGSPTPPDDAALSFCPGRRAWASLVSCLVDLV